MPTMTRSLTRLIRQQPVSGRDLAEAERFVRDWLGALAGGGATVPGSMLLAYAPPEGGLEDRVFLAAALSHITETDDLHRASVTHPGCVVVPVALLLGRSLDAGSERMLRAVLAGYEAMLRVGEALGPAHYRIFHNTATAGVFGAAAAAASLLDLSEDAWVWAFGNAGTQAAGLWEFNEDASMSKHLHAGHAAQAGLRAALLARVGFTGPAAILEGPRGFFRGLCPDARPERVLESAEGWKLPETSFKPYPSCRHTHPAIDAALTLRAALGDRSIQRVEIRTYPVALDVTDNPAPTSAYAAKFSIQYCVATALLNGAPGLRAFEPERIADPDLQALLTRISVSVDPGLAAAYPQAWGADLAVTDTSGRTESERVGSARGDPEARLEDADLDAKVRDLLRFGGFSESTAADCLAASKGMVRNGAPPSLPWLDHAPAAPPSGAAAARGAELPDRHAIPR